MKIYKLTFSEIDTKQKLKDTNKRITFQFNITDKQLREINDEFKDDYINSVKTKLVAETMKAMSIKL